VERRIGRYLLVALAGDLLLARNDQEAACLRLAVESRLGESP